MDLISCLYENKKSPILKGVVRGPGEMMFHHYTNNNIPISHCITQVYTKMNKKGELYQYMTFLGRYPKKTTETDVHVTHAIINIYKK